MTPTAELNNIVIAIYMAKVIEHLPDWNRYTFEDGTQSTDLGLAYHKSWNHLLPVIAKINDNIYGGYGGMIQAQINDNLKYVDIDFTYKKVVQFIEWYNKNYGY